MILQSVIIVSSGENIVDRKHMDFKKEIEENYIRNGAGRALFCSQ